MIEKAGLPAEIVTRRTLIRRAMQVDLPQLKAWPSYPWPHEIFSMMHWTAYHTDGRYWWEKLEQADRCHYSVIELGTGEIIGIHALVKIDWDQQKVGSMGIRIRADLCGMGYGAETLKSLLEAQFRAGIRSVRLDVASSNTRAVCCYQKCGMKIMEEFWQEHNGEPIDPLDSKWAFAIPHLRQVEDKWMTRFYWMESFAP